MSGAPALPPGLVCLADYEAYAGKTLDAGHWAYLNGGAADEITMAANRSAWDGLNHWPRVLRTCTAPATRSAARPFGCRRASGP